MQTPQPKYQIGDVFWVPEVVTETRRLDCPDCLGTRKWAVTTPAGGVLETECIRCSWSYRNDKLPSLDYETAVAKASRRLIHGIKLTSPDMPSNDWGEPVRYSCSSDSGTNWTIDESKTFATEADALAAAQTRADVKNVKTTETPEHVDKIRLSGLPFKDARFDEFKNGVWGAWYNYRRFKGAIVETIEDPETEGGTKEELIAALKDKIGWENHPTHRDWPKLVEFTCAVEDFLDVENGGKPEMVDRMIKARDALPKFQREILNGKTTWDH